MAAILGRPKRKRGGTSPTNYRITDRGRQYRVCAQNGRVLFVMLKHVHSEQALEVGKRRYCELVRLAAKQHGVELRT